MFCFSSISLSPMLTEIAALLAARNPLISATVASVRSVYSRAARRPTAAASSSSQLQSLTRGRPCGSPAFFSAASIASQPA